MNIIEMERKTGDFGFQAKDENGNVVQSDSSIENGGSNYGFRPMQLILAGLGSCSAIDIVSILKKQRQTVEDFKIKIAGEREKNKMPSLWESVEITFELYGNINTEKANKAASLSMEKHCSVAETLRRGGTQVTWNVKVINTEKALVQ
ncbi:OsmC family protein [Ginsengibacter hankyongi]|uniref:OsmC family protein n=1 Tax=Ginsengibacter hankyongi TaxID=2607284 RepID=A0A5J5IJ42_9BACT|nr:OsmC family protein [Ginsengibacter hankyongi]KAA9041070.1 OsmC family protein [Ginsengibacter hankyongi]